MEGTEGLRGAGMHRGAHWWPLHQQTAGLGRTGLKEPAGFAEPPTRQLDPLANKSVLPELMSSFHQCR